LSSSVKLTLSPLRSRTNKLDVGVGEKFMNPWLPKKRVYSLSTEEERI
jgi:hypothetical protein